MWFRRRRPELTNAAYRRWLRAWRPPLTWFLALSEIEQQQLAMLGDEWVEQLVDANRGAAGIIDPEEELARRAAAAVASGMIRGARPPASMPSMAGTGARRQESIAGAAAAAAGPDPLGAGGQPQEVGPG